MDVVFGSGPSRAIRLKIAGKGNPKLGRHISSVHSSAPTAGSEKKIGAGDRWPAAMEIDRI